MIRRILSIDIDCVMEPWIPRYDDDVVGSRVSAIEAWSSVTAPVENMTFCDNRWAVVKDILHHVAPSHVVFANNHHQILDVMPEGPLEILNFDHHHDVDYPGWNEDLPLHEGNWVGHLVRQGRVVSYTWYRNDNSEELEVGVERPPNYKEVSLPGVDLPEGSFDLVFICLSPNWIPPHLWWLRRQLEEEVRRVGVKSLRCLDVAPEPVLMS